MKGLYLAVITEGAYRRRQKKDDRAPIAYFHTIREAREWGRKWGDEADVCEIYACRARGQKLVAIHRRINGKWKRAPLPLLPPSF